MNTRLYKDMDYFELAPWWGCRWGDAPDHLILPKTGVICNDGTKDVAAVWAYLDMTSPVAFIAWVVGNPDATAKDLLKGLKVAINGVIELCRSQGRTAITTVCQKSSLASVFEECGFSVRDEDMKQLILNI